MVFVLNNVAETDRRVRAYTVGIQYRSLEELKADLEQAKTVEGLSKAVRQAVIEVYKNAIRAKSKKRA